MVKEIFVKTILNKHKKRDDWFLDDYSLNPYKSCEFNCIYCYIHGSKYGKHVNELSVKINAPALLRTALTKYARRKEYGFIALSSATEPWMYIEEKYKITRKCLEIIAKFRFPVHCLTKSTLILRDIDILQEIDKNAILPEDLRKINHGVLITISLSTLEDKIARIFEPNAPSPKERLETLQKIKEYGFHAGIAYIPTLPFISDSNEQLEEMVKRAKDIGADYVFFSPLTLYGVGKKIFISVLEKHFPELVPKYEKLYERKPCVPRNYSDQYFKKVMYFCQKHNVNFGITKLRITRGH